MRSRALSATLIARLAEQPETVFADQAAWSAHLDRLGFTALSTTPNPVQIATEGAIWGSIHAHDFLRDAVVLSDDAGQFAVGRHALCWVHAERLVHKLDAFTDHNRAAQQRVRKLIWDFYADLKSYQSNPDKGRRLALRARFDRIFRHRTGFVTLDRLLARLHANKAELLMVLDRPETPLHTNGSENDIRCQVTRRKSLPLRRRGSAPEHAAILAATAAMPSSVSPRPAPSSAWQSGTISAAASGFPVSPSFRPCRISSDAAGSLPDTPGCPGFCPYYALPGPVQYMANIPAWTRVDCV